MTDKIIKLYCLGCGTEVEIMGKASVFCSKCRVEMIEKKINRDEGDQ